MKSQLVNLQNELKDKEAQSNSQNSKLNEANLKNWTLKEKLLSSNNEIAKLKADYQNAQTKLEDLTNQFEEYKQAHEGSAIGRFFKRLFHRQ